MPAPDPFVSANHPELDTALFEQQVEPALEPTTAPTAAVSLFDRLRGRWEGLRAIDKETVIFRLGLSAMYGTLSILHAALRDPVCATIWSIGALAWGLGACKRLLSNWKGTG